MSDKELVHRILQKAGKAGAQEAEVYLERSNSSELTWRKNILDGVKQEESVGVGLRVRNNGKVGFAYTSDLTQNGVDRLIQWALDTAKYGDISTSILLPDESASRVPYTYDANTAHLTMRQKMEMLKETESTARLTDSRIIGFDSTDIEIGVREYLLADSEGRVHQGKGSVAGMSCTALASDNNETQSGYGVDISVSMDVQIPILVGRTAANRALNRLGAVQPESGVMDLILNPNVVRQLMALFAKSFSAEAVGKHTSFLEGKLGMQIAGTDITLVDDGTLDNRIGSGAYDGEGTPMQRTVLVDHGTVTSYLVDRKMAEEIKFSPTGNGIRSGYSGLPHISTTNLILEPGSISENDMIGGVEIGVYITDIMGAHTANPISGNFSLGASGILIEKGQLTVPVHRMTIAGNLLELLQKCDGIASNVEVLGSKSAPSIRIRELMVSGK